MHVVLIHGMGRTPLSMLRVRRRLREAGHHAVLFGYSPTFESLEGASARLAKRIAAFGGESYALVGHSLGSVIIRNALARLPAPPVACAFLAPPMVACRAARFFSRFWLYRILTGEMGQLLADAGFMQRLPLPLAPTRVYAGTAGPRRTWLPFGTEANDGILSASEAKGSFADAIEVPSLHTFIMHSRVVADDIARFLTAAEGEQERRQHAATA
jgi:pimeloyl-ACP methyl ester carboxylesterase